MLYLCERVNGVYDFVFHPQRSDPPSSQRSYICRFTCDNTRSGTAGDHLGRSYVQLPIAAYD